MIGTELLDELAERALALACAATQAAQEAQRAERTEHPPHSPRLPFTDRREVRDRFIYDLLLLERAISESDALRQAEIMGMDLRRPRAVILLDSGPSGGRDEAEALISRVVQFFHLPNDTICGYLGHGEVAILKASSTADLVAWARAGDRSTGAEGAWANLAALKRAADELAVNLRSTGAPLLALGVGRYHPGLHGLGLSYRDARTALSLGQRFLPWRNLYALDELGLGAWVGLVDEHTRRELAERLVSPLDSASELVQTLDIFFAEDAVPSSAAARLAIHRNTLSYRLDRVRRLTGLDPRRFDDAVQLRLALLLCRCSCANAQAVPPRAQQHQASE